MAKQSPISATAEHLLQFQLTSKSPPHSKCRIISLDDVIGFKSFCIIDATVEQTIARMKLVFHRAIRGETARVTVAVATDRCDDRIV